MNQPPRKRALKVGYLLVSRGGKGVRVPLLRLAGIWLREAGFKEGDSVEVLLQEGELRITTAGKVAVPKDQLELFTDPQKHQHKELKADTVQKATS